MKTDWKEKASATPTYEVARCRADGCTCSPCFAGLCEWHDRAENAKSWRKITEVMQTQEFKYLAWYWIELGKWIDRRMIDVHQPDGSIRWVIPADMIEFFRQRLDQFGIPRDKTERLIDEKKGPEALKHYAYRMRSLVMDKVMRDTGAIEERDYSMPSIQFQRNGDFVQVAQVVSDNEDNYFV